MADKQPNNQRYYDTFVKAADAAVNKSWEDQDAPAKAGIDAVVAAVRKDERARAENLRATQHTASYRMGREEAAEDIRSEAERAHPAGRGPMEHAARIAEGNTNRG